MLGHTPAGAPNAGVFGIITGNNDAYGVRGESKFGAGVFGKCETGNPGVHGTNNGTGAGVFGQGGLVNQIGIGVQGDGGAGRGESGRLRRGADQAGVTCCR